MINSSLELQRELWLFKQRVTHLGYLLPISRRRAGRCRRSQQMALGTSQSPGSSKLLIFSLIF